MDMLIWRESLISIHAPPRGATSTSADTSDSAGFQFTPLREGRQAEAVNSLTRRYFNSRPSARGDARFKPPTSVPEFISIHAPPRGATLMHSTAWRGFFYFNSRPSARGDSRARKACWRYSYFNSRPSARGDFAAVDNIAVWCGRFQFTPLREGRLTP